MILWIKIVSSGSCDIYPRVAPYGLEDSTVPLTNFNNSSVIVVVINNLSHIGVLLCWNTIWKIFLQEDFFFQIFKIFDIKNKPRFVFNCVQWYQKESYKLNCFGVTYRYNIDWKDINYIISHRNNTKVTVNK